MREPYHSFAEGSYNQRLSAIVDDELPAGSVIWYFDRTDMVAAKRALGGYACICGNVPAPTLALGPASEVAEYTMQLLDDVATDGGFVLAPGYGGRRREPRDDASAHRSGHNWHGSSCDAARTGGSEVRHVKLLVPALLVVVLLSMVLALASCGSSETSSGGASSTPSSGPTGEPFKIGFNEGFTGYAATDAILTERGILTALAQIDDQWMGGPVEYIKADNRSDPVVAVDKARQLVESDKIDVMLG